MTTCRPSLRASEMAWRVPELDPSQNASMREQQSTICSLRRKPPAAEAIPLSQVLDNPKAASLSGSGGTAIDSSRATGDDDGVDGEALDEVADAVKVRKVA